GVTVVQKIFAPNRDGIEPRVGSERSAGSSRDFAQAIHLIEILRTGPENEFIGPHILLTLDRVFNGCFRSWHGAQAFRRELRIISIVCLYVLRGVLNRLRAESKIAGAHPARLPIPSAVAPP